MSGSSSTSSRFDERELATFRAMAAEWWNPDGKFKPLHALGPVRLGYIRGHLIQRFALDPRAPAPLSPLTVADIGCGGGLLCEPLARLGASVTGIDPLPESIEAARLHAAGQDLAIDYRVGGSHDLAAGGARFNAVIAMEVVEHVPDVTAFVQSCAALVKPGGILILSTINRTLRSYALAIIGAEYVLRWLPVGTHSWEKFVKPEELAAACFSAGLKPLEERGCVFNPLTGEWLLSGDLAVNYFAAATRD